MFTILLTLVDCFKRVREGLPLFPFQGELCSALKDEWGSIAVHQLWLSSICCKQHQPRSPQKSFNSLLFCLNLLLMFHGFRDNSICSTFPGDLDS